MKQMKLIMILAMLLPIAASAQEERIDTVIPIAVGTGTWGIAAVIPKYLSLRLRCGVFPAVVSILILPLLFS